MRFLKGAFIIFLIAFSCILMVWIGIENLIEKKKDLVENPIEKKKDLVENPCKKQRDLVENPSKKKSDQGNGEYDFMVVGHAYTYPKKNSNNNGLNPDFLRFFKKIAASIRLVVFTGDFTHDGLDTQWDCVYGQIQKLPVATHFVPGNHDLGNNNDHQVSTFLRKAGRDKLYGSFWEGEDLFVILSGFRSEMEQVEFLKKEIKKKHRHLFVFMHYIWWAQEYGLQANTDVGPKQFWQQVFSLLKAYNKKVFVFGGDTRARFDIIKEGDITLISNGLNPESSPLNTVAIVRVRRDEVDIVSSPLTRKLSNISQVE